MLFATTKHFCWDGSQTRPPRLSLRDHPDETRSNREAKQSHPFCLPHPSFHPQPVPLIAGSFRRCSRGGFLTRPPSCRSDTLVVASHSAQRKARQSGLERVPSPHPDCFVASTSSRLLAKTVVSANISVTRYLSLVIYIGFKIKSTSAAHPEPVEG